MERITKKADKEKRDKNLQDIPCQNCSCSEIDESLKPLLALKKKDLVKIIQIKNDLLMYYINKEEK
tara:strand:+ start:309 stop:506 length:198 start_codon:yes stop_codon:yes gene_type:complete